MTAESAARELREALKDERITSAKSLALITAALKRCRNEALEEAAALAKGWAKEWVMKTDRQRFDTYQVEFQRRNVGIGIAEDIAKLKEAE